MAFRSPVLRDALIVTAALCLVMHAVHAQPYPNRPIRWVLGFAPAGSPDVIARVLAQQLTSQLGQHVVLDNRPGANGIVGAELVAKAAADGYTLLITPAAFAINPSVYRKLPFDALKSFTPITNLCVSEGLLLVVNAALAVQNVQQLIELAKQPGSRMAYGSSGTGNVTHLAGALFSTRTGVSLTHVPYKGGGPMTAALLSGDIQLSFTNLATIYPQVKAGKVRAIAFNSPARASFLPEVPTLRESGVDGMEIDPSWYGVFAPAGAPSEIIKRLHAEIHAALQVPAVRNRLATLGMTPVGSTPAEFRAFVERAIQRFAELTKIAGIKPE